MKKAVFKWKEGSKLSGDAQSVGEQLEEIRKANGGFLSATDVVRMASKKRRSELGQIFEWDDTVAAAKHREDQARGILRWIVVVGVDPQYDKPVRAFVRIIQDDESMYTSTQRAMSEPALREQILVRAKKEAKEWRERYQDLKELASVFAAIDGL